MLAELAFGGLFALGGLLMITFGLVTYARGRVIARGPKTPMGNEGKQVYCTGTVATDNCEVGPLSGEPCVNYVLKLERDSGGDHGGYTDVSEVRTTNEFIVDEGDARIRFEPEILAAHPEMFEYPFQVNYAKERVEDESDIPESVRETGLMDDENLSLTRERLTEVRLEHGDDACCVGTFEGDHRADATHRFRSGGVTTDFSNESPEQFEKGNNLVSVAAYVVFGLGFATPGTGMLLVTLGWV
ncbi:hypothetical protein [Haloglomus halophilum]|uniref:hypothetical protein n=1 Tax=Haloglomus halophilum TaxID=2962672 RepID=UPI0020C9BA56|nr:hypothetical protein [Haloglomus halophilum]